MALQGVRLMFYDSKADVLLLMITATIPDKFKPYLLGFDASVDAVPTQAVGIHHPNGNVKRISYANDRQAHLSAASHLPLSSLARRTSTCIGLDSSFCPCLRDDMVSAQR